MIRWDHRKDDAIRSSCGLWAIVERQDGEFAKSEVLLFLGEVGVGDDISTVQKAKAIAEEIEYAIAQRDLTSPPVEALKKRVAKLERQRREYGSRARQAEDQARDDRERLGLERARADKLQREVDDLRGCEP